MRRAVKQQIRRRIRSFDAPALLQLLAEKGVAPLQIRYRGNPGTAPQQTLLHNIEFSRKFQPGRRGHVTIVVNLGLVSCRSPLPSYLLALLREADHSEQLLQILDFLDNKLIGERLRSFRPELDPRLVRDWAAVRSDMLDLTSKPSPSRIHWIFQRVFPQIGVCVERAPVHRHIEAPEVRLGSGEIGVAAFGGEAAVTVPGLDVTLICPEPVTFNLTPWLVEARERLDSRVFPVLRRTGIHLTVVLLLLDPASPAQLDGQSYVDYNPLAGGSPGPTRIVLFSGPIPEEKPDSSAPEARPKQPLRPWKERDG